MTLERIMFVSRKAFSQAEVLSIMNHSNGERGEIFFIIRLVPVFFKQFLKLKFPGP